MDIKKNPLDEIEGVGRAAVVDLEKVDGINRALAERIHGFFHPEMQH